MVLLFYVKYIHSYGQNIKRKQEKRLVYLIYLINILEDPQYLSMFESTSMSKSCLSHQVIDERRPVCMYTENRMSYFGFVGSSQRCGERREGRGTIYFGHDALCVKPFLGTFTYMFS